MWNSIKTVFLLATMSAILLFFGQLIGGYGGLQIAFILALIMNGVMYFYSDRIVLKLYHAQPLNKTTYGWVYDIVQELAQRMQIPMPQLWLIDTPMANAFATGRNPAHASVAVTTGILAILDKEELRGVLAHELSHVKNRDILISTIAATLATTIGYVANMARYAAFWAQNKNNERRSNPLFMLLAGILMPIAATLIQLAISRSREYLADESGADASADPEALASALEKLHTHVKDHHFSSSDVRHASTAPLFIVYPFLGSGWTALFSTHPPMHKRIAKLRAMSKKLF